MADICRSLKVGGKILIAEPMVRVSEDDFRSTVSLAQARGLDRVESPRIRRSHALAMIKRTGRSPSPSIQQDR